jgi:hypothetical protein
MSKREGVVVEWVKMFNFYPHTCNLIYGWVSGITISKRPINFEKFHHALRNKNVIGNEEVLFKHFDDMHILIGITPISKINFKVYIKGLDKALATSDLKTRTYAIKYAVEKSIEMLEERIVDSDKKS